MPYKAKTRFPINEGADSGETEGYGTSGQQVDVDVLEQDMVYCLLKLNVIII
jgi:hypothetical protein